jgi:hypothetical protein
MNRIVQFFIASALIGVVSIATAGDKDLGQSINLNRVTVAIERTLTYQGILKDNSGDPVVDNSYNLTFRIYENDTGGSAIWTSPAIPTITKDGYFSAILAGISLPFDTTYYLSVQVQGDTEMNRQIMTMSPYSASSDTANYAFRADTATYALSSGGGGGSRWTLAGTVLSTNDYWGITKGNAGNSVFGDSARTMVNLGSYSQTGSTPANRYYATIGGGAANQARSNFSTIAGGNGNITYASGGTIGGGAYNEAYGNYSGVAAGDSNSAGNGATDDGAFVGGGCKNIINGKYSATVGGYSNSSTNWYDFIGGGLSNRITGQAAGIGGGISDTIAADFGGIASGYSNIAGDSYADTAAFVGGGYGNMAMTPFSTLCGGNHNYIGGYNSFIGGGEVNSAPGIQSTITGGYNNISGGSQSAICGGSFNFTGAGLACIGGGYGNEVYGSYSGISGGYDNMIHTIGSYASIGGGFQNVDSATYSSIAGGDRNSVTGAYGFIGGGQLNNVENTYSAVLGGRQNKARGSYSSIPGGYGNRIDTTGSYSMAFGSQVHVAEGYRVDLFDGSQPGYLGINRDSDNGGISYPIHVGTSASNGNGAYLSAGGVWTNGSSRTFKENFTPFNGEELLSKISNLSITTYNYINSTEKHFGPVAEDFVGAFDTGVIRESDGKRDDQYLAAGDVAGVALAGVQELLKKIEALEKENAQIKAEIKQLKSR